MTPQTAQTLHRPAEAEAEPGIGITRVVTEVDSQPIRNDLLIPVSRLARGFRIVCDAPLSEESFGTAPPQPSSAFKPETVAGKPTCVLTLDLPYPLGTDRQTWNFTNVIGFQPVVLASTVKALGTDIIWHPAGATSEWLKDHLFQQLKVQKAADRVLARVSVKGNFIWRGDAASEPTVYLDGEAFGIPAANGRVGLRFPSGNGRRGGDFEMWFWLMPAAAGPAPGLTITAKAVNNVISGKVLDAAEPVAGVAVRAIGPVTLTAVTKANGQYRIQVTTAGTYRVSVESAGESAETTVVVGQG